MTDETSSQREPIPTAEELSDEQLAKAKAWIDAHWSNKKCPFHPGPTRWHLERAMFGHPVFGQKSLQRIDYLLLTVALSCSTCGYVVHVAARPMGIIPPLPRLVPAGPTLPEE